MLTYTVCVQIWNWTKNKLWKKKSQLIDRRWHVSGLLLAYFNCHSYEKHVCLDVVVFICFIPAHRFGSRLKGQRKLEQAVIVLLKSTFDTSAAFAPVTHPHLFHCVVPRCSSACVSIHHVCACCTKADPLQNRLQSVIRTELSPHRRLTAALFRWGLFD